MKSAIIILILTLSNFLYGQDLKSTNLSYNAICTYQLTYQPDSTNAEKETELFLLFTSQNKSLFLSKNRYFQDSVLLVLETKSTDAQDSITYFRQNPTNFDFKLVKNKCNNVTVMDRIYHTYYSYSDSPLDFKWKIQEDTTTISGFPCQKAVGKFGGRDWVAWFTGKTNLNDGPYKFCGLPGLIIKIVDTDQYHDFTLVSITENSKEILEFKANALIETDKLTFLKMRKEYNEDPIGVAEQSGVVFTSGKNEISQRMKRKAKDNNNPIERDNIFR